MTKDLVNSKSEILLCPMHALEALRVNCLECPYFDDCFDSVMELAELPFSEPPGEDIE